MDHHDETHFDRALAVSTTVRQELALIDISANGIQDMKSRSPVLTFPPSRPSDSRDELQEYCTRSEAERNTVFYLAYGSNLCNETFLGKRGIKPLAAINVQVPSLRLTFDLPGLPYIEPCFANSGVRDPRNDPLSQYDATRLQDDKDDGYRKDRWHKGLLGVVYEVTPADYAHIIATEGGGQSYKDILVDCYPFASADLKTPVPQDPATPPFKAHTLFAPAAPAGSPLKDAAGRLQRPDPSYAQASARYLKLITDGAAERGLPLEYQDYLHSLQPFTITTRKQLAGKVIFSSIWLPIVAFVFLLAKMFAGDDGRIPSWLGKATATVFVSVWTSYDNVFKNTFGDGERTIGDHGTCHGRAGILTSLWRPTRTVDIAPCSDLEKADFCGGHV